MTAEANIAPHWRFSLAVYGSPGVAPACLLLQDRCGLDVNVLLLALYAVLELEQSMDDGAIADLDAQARSLRESVVVPLRKIRQHMKGRDYGAATEKVRQQVKKAELMAEELEQSLLAEWVAGRPASNSPSDARATAQRVVRHSLQQRGNGGTLDAEEEAAVALIAAAAGKVAAAQAGE